MACEHYFVVEAGYQLMSEEDAGKLGRDCFLLGLCIIQECRTCICADSYTKTGEFFEGHELLFSPELDRIIKEAFN